MENIDHPAFWQASAQDSHPSAQVLNIFQRRLVFEEPTAKWLHLQRAFRRAFRRLNCQQEGEGEFDWGLYPDVFESAIYGANQKMRLANRVMHVLLAAQEVMRFSDSALTRWQSTACQLQLFAHCKNSDWQAIADADGRAQDWLRFAYQFALPWHLITQADGPENALIRTFLLKLRAVFDETDTFTPQQFDWEKWIQRFSQAVAGQRAKLPASFLPNQIILVEGITEEILLPCLARSCGLDLNALGALVVASGGANQVVRKYRQLKESLAVPIFCLLDQDASEQGQMLAKLLRPQDLLYVFKNGEIEDVFQLDMLVRLLNSYLDNLAITGGNGRPIRIEDFEEKLSRTQTLAKIWRQRNLGKFDKVGFARLAACEINDAANISADGRDLIDAIGALGLPPRM
jgi:hypothetical protein